MENIPLIQVNLYTEYLVLYAIYFYRSHNSLCFDIETNAHLRAY